MESLQAKLREARILVQRVFTLSEQAKTHLDDPLYPIVSFRRIEMREAMSTNVWKTMRTKKKKGSRTHKFRHVSAVSHAQELTMMSHPNGTLAGTGGRSRETCPTVSKLHRRISD